MPPIIHLWVVLFENEVFGFEVLPLDLLEGPRDFDYDC